MNRLFLIALFLATAAAGFAQQDTSLRLWRSYKGPVADATLDNLGNLYLLTASDQLKKYGPRGDSIAVYNNVRKFGKVHALDVSNPLKVLLYYKDFATIVVLDRLLAVRTTLDLRRRQILQASAVSLSYDGNIWLFDGYDSKLKKVTEEGDLLLETPDFRQLFGEAVSPRQIIDQDNLLYVYDSARGLYLFDRYGTFKRKVPLAGWTGVHVSDNYITGIAADKTLRVYNRSTLLESTHALPPALAVYDRYLLARNKLIAIAKDSIGIFDYPLR